MIRDRRSIRLSGYDYSSPGAYFVTACTQGREPLFGRVHGGATRLSEAGRIVQATWEALPQHYAHIALDAWIVMPDHVHMIIVINPGGRHMSAGGAGADLRPAPTLSQVVLGLKSFSARRINEMRGTVGARVWQRNYYERIIRDQRAWDQIRRYIADNPASWARSVEAAPSTRRTQRHRRCGGSSM